MGRIKAFGLALIVLIGISTAWPSAQGSFWVLVNGVLNYTGNIVVNGTSTLNGSVTATSLSTTGNGVAITGSGSLFLVNTILFGTTAPTISSGFGSSPSIASSNGNATFRVNVGGGGVATSGVIGLSTASTGWNCIAIDMTTNVVTRETASTTASATLTAASAWGANDILLLQCEAY